MSIEAIDFYSDEPPERVIGTESEYDVRDGKSSSALRDLLSQQALRKQAIRNINGYLGEEFGAGRLYHDVHQLEYCTRESMGPAAAAVEDINSIDRVIQIIDKLEIPHQSMHRLGGTFTSDKSGSSSTKDSTVSRGYHENYLVPANNTTNGIFRRLVASTLASRAFLGGGAIKDGKYVMAQKIWSCGQAVVDGKGMPTTVRYKPMASIPSQSDDISNDASFTRLEVRCSDPSLSVVNAFLRFASMSLTLRLTEQARKLDLTEQSAYALAFVNPVSAGQVFAADLTQKFTAQTMDSRRITALDHQEQLLELYESFGERSVELPADEQFAIACLRSVIDGLRSSIPAASLYSGEALAHTEFAYKHIYATAQSRYAIDSADAMHRSIEWNRIIPHGPGSLYWRKVEAVDPMAQSVTMLAQQAASMPRSVRRAMIVDKAETDRYSAMTWSTVKLDGTITSLGSPAGD